MMNWDDIERRLADHNDHHDIDTDALWSQVQPHIPNDSGKDRKVLFVVFGILCLTCMSWMYLNQATYSDREAALKEREQLEYATTRSQQETMTAESKKASTISKSESNEIASANTKTLSTTEAHDMNGSTRGTATANELTSTETNGTPQTRKLHAQQNWNTNANKHMNITSSDGKVSALLANSSATGNNQPINTSQSALPSTGLNAKTHESLIDHTSLVETAIVSTSAVRELSFLDGLPISPLDFEFSLADVPAPEMAQIPVTREKLPLRLFVEGGISGSYGHGAISLTDQDAQSQYSMRKAAEKSLPSYGAHIMAGLALDEHWSIRSGLRYSSLYKMSEADITLTQDITVDDVVVAELFSDTGTRQVLGSVTAQESRDRSARRINQYSLINIPLEVMYSLAKRKWSYDIGAGAAATISHSRSGYIHPAADSEYNITQDAEGIYKDGTLWSLGAMAGVSYQLAPQIDVYTRARYQHYLTAVSAGDSPIRETLSGGHLDFGIRYSL